MLLGATRAVPERAAIWLALWTEAPALAVLGNPRRVPRWSVAVKSPRRDHLCLWCGAHGSRRDHSL